MKRQPIRLALAGLEILRFFIVISLALAGGAASRSDGTAQVARALASPGLVLSFMFFLLWLDSGRYRAYIIAIVAGKLLAFFSMGLAIPSLILAGPIDAQTRLSIAGAAIVACYDLGSLLATAFFAKGNSSGSGDDDRFAVREAAPAVSLGGIPGDIENVTVS